MTAILLWYSTWELTEPEADHIDDLNSTYISFSMTTHRPPNKDSKTASEVETNLCLSQINVLALLSQQGPQLRVWVRRENMQSHT